MALIPHRVRVFFGNRIGDLFCFFGFRRKIVEQNLARCFPQFAESDRRDLLRRFYRHFGNLLVELTTLLGGLRRFSKRVGRLHGLDRWKAAQSRGRGVLLVSSHLGNWEVMAATGAQLGIDILLVTKQLKPLWLHRRVESVRRTARVLGTYEPATLKEVLKHLKRGGTVGWVLDQYAGPPVGVRVPFFGTWVGTQSALALLAKRTGSPVLSVCNWRNPDGTFEVEIGEEIPWIAHADPQFEIGRNTAGYVQVLEEAIRRHPEQWLWTHRRFKGDLSLGTEGEWEQGRPRTQLDSSSEIS